MPPKAMYGRPSRARNHDTVQFGLETKYDAVLWTPRARNGCIVQVVP